MKIKLLLIIAITSATLFMVMGTLKQAHAYNMVISIGSENVLEMVKMAKKEDDLVLQEQDQIVLEGKVDDKSNDLANDVATIEPAGG